ncbi:MAG: hypothetical protein IJ593_05875 [Lachnospiraceae bacterium]|nr:hypothetical protein [Lachnospiraceae bacterium]
MFRRCGLCGMTYMNGTEAGSNSSYSPNGWICARCIRYYNADRVERTTKRR